MIETNLKSYSSEEIKTANLPEKIQEIGHLVEFIEMTNVDTQLETTTKTYEELKKTAKEPTDICVVGSNGMYLLFEDLKAEGDSLQILKQRCQKGKNDLDFGLTPEQARRGDQIWSFENWVQNEDRHSGGHGTLTIEDRKVVVDLLQRPQLKGFEWIETKYKDKVLKIQTPEEMIFEKIRSLARSDITRIPLKWGIDVKLLKYYMIKTQGFESDDKLDEYLAKRWEEYQDSQREQDAVGLIGQRINVETYSQLISRVLNQPIEQIMQALERTNGYSSSEVQHILESETDEIFIQKYIELSRKDKNRMTYTQVSEKAIINFINAVKASESHE